jgi:hypothetical protein
LHVQPLEPRELLTTVSVQATTPDAIQATQTPGVFTVTALGAPAGQAVTVQYSVSGTASSSDYASLPGSVTIPAGQTTATIDVTPTTHSETSNVTVTLTLATSGNYRLADQSSDTVTIEEPAPTLAVLDGITPLTNGSAVENFGTTGYNSPVTRTFTVANTGTATLSLNPNSLDLPAGFSVVTPLPSTVAAGHSATFQVELTGTTPGSASGDMTFTDSDVNNDPYSITLEGTVNSPAASISVVDGTTTVVGGGSNIAFGSTPDGTPVAQMFTISNTGTSTLTLGQVSVPSGFSVTTSPDASVAPGTSTTLVIQMDATTAGPAGGQVSFSTNDALNSTFQFQVNGTVTPAEPALVVLDNQTTLPSGSSTDSFGTASAGTPLEKTLTIDNTGTANLTLDPQTLVLPTGFSVVSPFAATVSPGGSTTLDVELNAAAGGSFSGTLSFNSNDPNTQTYQLSISGNVTAPAIQVSQASTVLPNNNATVSFGVTPYGTPVSKTFTVTNVGNDTLQLNPSSLSVPLGFSVSEIYAGSLAPGQSTQFVVQLDATGAQTLNGTLAFSTNDPLNPLFSFAITGQVTAPAAQVLDGSTAIINGQSTDDLGTTVVGTPESKTFTVNNLGTSALTIAASSFALPSGFTLSAAPAASVAAGGSTSFTVEATAAAAGDLDGTISFATNDPAQPTFAFAITAEITAPALEVLNGSTVLVNNQASVSLGTTGVGSPLLLALSIDNTGNGTLSLNTNSVVLPTGFAVAAPFASSVAPGGSTTVAIELTATAVGTYSGTFSFTDGDAQNSPFSMTVSGTVAAPPPPPAPAIEILNGSTVISNGGSLSFGTVTQGTQATDTLTIKNNGNAPLTIGSITAPSAFSTTSPTLTTIQPGLQSTFQIKFYATSSGLSSGSLIVPDNDPNNDPFIFNVSGYAMTEMPTIVLSQGSTTLTSNSSTVYFPSTVVGTPQSETFTIQNMGMGSLSIYSVSVPSGYTVTQQPTSSVASGNSTTFTVKLNATSSGTASGSLSISSSDYSHNPFNVTLNGKVASSGPAMAVLDGSIVLGSNSTDSFGTTPTLKSVTKTFTIDNNGTSALSLGTITVPSGFTVTQPQQNSLSAGASTTFTVTMTAATAGTYSGSLSMTDGDPNNSPFSFTLSGTVQTAIASMNFYDGSTLLTSGGSDSFGTTGTGFPAYKTFNIYNPGNGTLTLTTSSITVPSGFTLTSAPAASVAPGGVTTMTVEMNAATAGTYSGTLSVPDNVGGGGTFSITISGTAVTGAPVLKVVDMTSGNAISNGGTYAFGSTPLGTSLYDVLEIENTGTSNLTINGSSLSLPAGFSVASALGATSVAPGGLTTLGISFNAATAGASSGALSFTTNDPNNATYSITLSGTATPPAPSSITVAGFGLVDELGLAGSLTSADPIVKGTVDGTFNGGSVIVQFDTTGQGSPTGSVPAITAAGTSFTFDPRTVDPGLVGYLGAANLWYRTETYDAADTLIAVSSWTEFSFTVANRPAGAHVDHFGLINNTGTSANDTYDPRVEGNVDGPFTGVSVTVQFAENGSTTPDGSITGITAPGMGFSYDPTIADPSLIGYSGPFTLDFRTVEYDTNGNLVATGSWNALTMTLYAPTPKASVTGFQLVHVTDPSASPPATSEPEVEGTVGGSFSNEVVEVQFSHHGDGVVDGVATVSATGQGFAYNPLTTEPDLVGFVGTLPLEYRTVEFDSHGGKIFGSWVSFPIHMELAKTTATIASFQLTTATISAGPPPVTSNPQVQGQVIGAEEGSEPTIQFQYNGDGNVDEQTTANYDGTFSDSLPGLPYGQTTVSARVVEWDGTDGYYLYGAWSTLSFDYTPAPAPSVTMLELADPISGSTTTTNVATVQGQVAEPVGGGQIVNLQFETNGGSQPDATGATDPQGNFTFSPVDPAYGTQTVSVRSDVLDPVSGTIKYSPWVSITFTYAAPTVPPPTVTDLQLADPTGPAGSETVTSNAEITGRVEFPPPPPQSGNSGSSTVQAPPSPDFLTVQIDTTGDGTPDATTTTGVGGTFSFTPTGLSAGPVTVAFRAVTKDAAGNTVDGPWASFTFTYQPPPSNLPTISELAMASPLPADEVQAGSDPSNLPVVSDPTITGQLTPPASAEGNANNPASSVAGDIVQFDTNDDGTPDASVVADANGDFSFTPSGLSYGSVTVQARVEIHNYTAGGFTYGPWTPISFIYQQPTFVAPTIASLMLADDSGGNGHTANPTLIGVASSPLPLGEGQGERGSSDSGSGSSSSGSDPAVLVQIDTNDSGTPDATITPDSQGNFIFTPQNVPYGTVTMQARAEAWDPFTNTYQAGAWSDITFTYEQETYAAPVIANLALLDANGQPTTSTVTSQPEIGGQLSYQGGLPGLTVQFDTTGGGTPDGSATTDQYGDFSFAPTGLSYGNVTVYVRTVSSPVPEGEPNAGSVLTGPWTPFTFTYQAPSVPLPSVSTLELSDITQSPSSANTTSDPTVGGTVSFPAPAATGATTTAAAPSVAALTVQFEVGSSVIGSTVTDSQGNFSFTPTGLTDGAVTIEARAVTRDASGDAIDGPWTSLNFTLVAAPTGGETAGGDTIASLALADNVGPSSTALISTNGSIVGTLAGPDVADQTVEIDTNGDGVSDATVTTDSHGNFSYTPSGLPQGITTIGVRTAADAQAASGSGTGSSSDTGGGSNDNGSNTGADATGGWTTVTFVLSSDPSSGQVQSEAEALATATSDNATAQSNESSATNSADASDQSSEASSSATYSQALAGASATQQSSDTAARQQYNSTLAGANQTYNSAVSQAAANYQSAISSYSGNTASYDMQKFDWPDAPAGPPAPADAGASNPPVAAPSDGGPAFDPTQDPGYQSAAATAKTTEDAALLLAESTDSSAVAAADATQASAVATASAAMQQALVTATANYNTALAATNPYSVAAAAATDASDDQTAANTYNSTLAADAATFLSTLQGAFSTLSSTALGAGATHDAAYPPALATYETAITNDQNILKAAAAAAAALDGEAYTTTPPNQGLLNAAQAVMVAGGQTWSKAIIAARQQMIDTEAAADETYDTTLDGAFSGYNTTAAGAQLTRTNSDADALDADQKTVHLDQLNLTLTTDQANEWAAANLATATDAQARAIAAAQAAYNVALALAQQAHDDTVAAAAQQENDSIADATAADATALANAAATAAANWAASENTPWATEQAALAQATATETDSDSAAQDTLTHSQDLDQKNETVAQDAAQEGQTAAQITDQQTSTDTQADAVMNLAIAKAQATQTRADDDARAWKTMLDASSDADQAYTKANATANQTLNNNNSSASDGYFNAIAGADEALAEGGTVASYDQAIQSAETGLEQAQAGNYNTFVHSDLDARGTRASAKTTAANTYQTSYHADEASWSQANETADTTCETTLVQAGATQDENDTAAAASAANQVASAVATQVGDDAAAQATFFNAEAGAQKVQDVTDAQAQATLEETNANNYAAALAAWAASLSGTNSPDPAAAPHASELAAFAAADATWTTTVDNAQVTDVTNTDSAMVIWTGNVGTAQTTDVTDDAAAAVADVEAVTGAAVTDADTDDPAIVTESAAESANVTIYDNAAVGAAQTEEDGQSAQQKILQDAVDSAQWVYLGAVADDQLAVTNGTKTFAQYQSDLAGYQTTQTNSVATAGVTFANTVAGLLQTEVKTVDAAKITWSTNDGTAETGLVSTLVSDANTETTTDDDAGATLVGTVASDAAALATAVAGDDQTLTDASMAADQVFTEAEDGADAADTVGYTDAAVSYQDTLANNLASALAAAAQANPTPLAEYESSVAQAEATGTTEDGGALETAVQTISAADQAQADSDEGALVNLVDGIAAAATSETNTLAPEEAADAGQAADDVAAADIADTAAGGTYLNAAASAVTTDQKANVTAQANFDDAVSGEEITWVSTMAAASAAVYTGSMSDASYESTLQTASATRAAAIQNDNIPRVTAIGNAEITEATSLSGAGVTLAGSEGTDEEGLVSGLAGVANTLAGQEKSADTAFVSAVTGDATTFAEATAGDEQTDVSADDAAGVGYQQTAGDNEVTEANSVAGDDDTYQEAIADQEESADQNFASEYPSGQNTETADFAQAFAQWISEVAGSFVSDSTAVAQDDATYQDALAVAGQALDNAQETANVAFVDADAPAQATETQGITAAQDTYAVDVANEVGTDAIATAGADATDDTTIATGDGAWTLALAQSDKAYQVAVAQNGGVANSTITAARVAAVALAQENLTINVAGADLAWITGKAAADEGFAVTDAGNWQTMIDGEATAVDGFAHTDDAAVKTANDAAGAAQAALMNAQAAADQAQENGDAGAEANFSEAEANDESSVMSGFASSMGTPWAQFEAALAAAQASEAQTEGNDLVAYVQALGLAEVNYTSNDAGQFTSEVQTIDAADKTSADSQADAWQTLVDTEAGDEATFETTMAPVVQGWQVATAQAADGDTVALAQALYNFTTGAISQSGYQTAVAAANAAQATADETANQTYSSAYGTTQSSQMTSDANANLAAVTATVNAILTDIKADAAAIDLYLDDESGYYDGEEKADAGALETYTIGVANAQAAAAESLEQSDPSPWAAQDAAAAAAQAAQIASQAAAQQTSTDSGADAEEASEIASNDAQLALTDAQAQSWHDQALAMATGQQALELAQASSIGSQAAADATSRRWVQRR